MSDENVQVVREIYERWQRGDFSSAEWFDPDIEFRSTMGLGQVGDARGVAELDRSWYGPR